MATPKKSKVTIKRNELAALINGIKGISREGNVNYDFWLKLEKLLQYLLPIAQEQNKLIDEIENKQGLKKLLARIQQAQEENQDYIPSPVDKFVQVDTEEKISAFGKEDLVLELVIITGAEIKNIKADGLKYRTDIFKIIDTKASA